MEIQGMLKHVRKKRNKFCQTFCCCRCGKICNFRTTEGRSQAQGGRGVFHIALPSCLPALLQLSAPWLHHWMLRGQLTVLMLKPHLPENRLEMFLISIRLCYVPLILILFPWYIQSPIFKKQIKNKKRVCLSSEFHPNLFFQN